MGVRQIPLVCKLLNACAADVFGINMDDTCRLPSSADLGYVEGQATPCADSA